MLGLRAGDITLEGETAIYAYRGKGGKRGRRELARTSRRWLPRSRSGRRARGRRAISSGTFYAPFRRYLLAACFAPAGLHIVRHTAAKLRRDAGESVEAVSAFLDHSSLAVTKVYLRRLEGETDRAWADVAAAIGV